MKTTILTAILLLALAAPAIQAQSYDQNLKNNMLIIEVPQKATSDNMISLNNPEDRIHIYPNPSRGTFYLNSTQTGEKIQIYDPHGQQVYDAEIRSEKYPVDLSSHAKGIYTYHITDQGTLVQQGKIVLE